MYPNHYEVIVFTADKQYIFADKYKDDDAYVFERGTYYITYEKNKLSEYSVHVVVDGVDYKMNFRMDSPDVMYFGDDTPQKRDNTDYTFIEKQKQAKP